jgi:hypothetical protein
MFVLLEAAFAAAARGISLGLWHFGRVPGLRHLLNWLIPPTPRTVRQPTPRGGSRLSHALVPVPIPARPIVRPDRRGTSRPPAASIWWAQSATTGLDSPNFGAPVSHIQSWPRRTIVLTLALAVITFSSASSFGQCCGGSCGGCPSMCSPGPGCCCPSGGCGFGCAAGCGCPRAPFGFGIFGGGRCCQPCGSCCGPACSGGCGPMCGPRCGPICGSPCGTSFCGSPPCCGSYCGGPACGMACGPCAPGACGAGCSGSCAPSCGAAPGPCGAGCCPTPTYGSMPGIPPGSSNQPGYPPSQGPGEPIPGVAPTTIPKRPAVPTDDKGTRFERRPVGSSGTASAVDVSDNSPTAGDQPPPRLFRQSVSAGFHTRVLTAQNSRAVAVSRDRRSLPFSARPEDEVARTE